MLAIEQLPAKQRLVVLLAEKARRAKGRRIEAMYPDEGPFRRELYPKHMAFLEAGATERVRAAIAANRVGKTEGMGGYELVCHLTGVYPAWWKGKRFAKPVRAWAAGDTGKTTKEILQDKLLGSKEAPGTGIIPDRYIDWSSKRAKPGVEDGIGSIAVKHASGGWSRLTFKSYDQGRKAFQGTETEVILLDEEPDLDILSECLLRTMTVDGRVMLTFTPLQGLTPVIKHLRETGAYEVGVTWDDVPHLTEKDKAEILKDTPVHLRDARSKGVPLLGSGLVFQVPEDDIVIEPLARIPDHWVRIGALDFGWDHPSAAAELAWDQDADIVYVVRCARKREATPLIFAAQVKPWGAVRPGSPDQWLPWAWPADGLQHDKGSGLQLAKQYREQGLLLLPVHAQWEDGGVSVEAGVMEMTDRMQTGRWKVFSTCSEWREEFRNYHRDEGVIVKEMDDAISASRYGLMMLRFAIAKPLAVRRGDFQTVGDRSVGY